MQADVSTERSLIRTIASTSRKPTEDDNVSPLKAIDRLLTLNTKFREHWITPPWLVLKDCYTIAANMPVPLLLAEIEKHGDAIGLVGMAKVSGGERRVVLKVNFRKDRKSQKTVDVSAQAALNNLNERVQALFSAEVFLNPDESTFQMAYSFHPQREPEPGSVRVGSIVYSRDGQIRCLFDANGKARADVMDEAKARFSEVAKKLSEIKSAEVQS
jgi:hypothetical protein